MIPFSTDDVTPTLYYDERHDQSTGSDDSAAGRLHPTPELPLVLYAPGNDGGPKGNIYNAGPLPVHAAG